MNYEKRCSKCDEEITQENNSGWKIEGSRYLCKTCDKKLGCTKICDVLSKHFEKCQVK